MPLSYVRRLGDGNTTSFTFSFTGQDEGYIRESDIVVLVDGAPASFTLLSFNTLELTTAPAYGSEIIIRRVMPKNVPYADFQRGNNFGQEVLNNSFLQTLYILHEILDGWFPDGFIIRSDVEFEGGLSAVDVNTEDPNAVITLSVADDRYLNTTGGTLQGSIDMDEYPLRVRVAVESAEPIRKDTFEARIATLNETIEFNQDGYQAGDASLQEQISGLTEIAAAERPTIQWHSNTITNSINIPQNVNAFTAGPSINIESGQSVSVGAGSTWTILNGAVAGDITTGSIENYDEGTL